jgi:hypothetical protein
MSQQSLAVLEKIITSAKKNKNQPRKTLVDLDRFIQERMHMSYPVLPGLEQYVYLTAKEDLLYVPFREGDKICAMKVFDLDSRRILDIRKTNDGTLAIDDTQKLDDTTYKKLRQNYTYAFAA